MPIGNVKLENGFEKIEFNKNIVSIDALFDSALLSLFLDDNSR